MMALLLSLTAAQDDVLYAALLKHGPKWDEKAKLDDHIEYWKGQEQKKVLVAGGPYTDGSGGLIILRAKDLAEAKAIVEADPAVKSGLIAADVRPWRAVLGELSGSALRNPEDPRANLTAPAEFKVKFETSKGAFVVKVVREWSPRGADRFYSLAKLGFFDGCRFFRVVSGFVAQFGLNGDPKVSAAWKDANLEDDPVKSTNTRGRITFATAGPDTRTTQLFINYRDNSRLDKMGFSPFGEVVEGMEVVDALYSGYGDDGGPDQGKLQTQGNAYLEKDFPKLDSIKTARVEE